MLYLIGGTSRSGKSLMARNLLKEKGIPYLPLDALVMGFTHGLPEYRLHDKLFPDEIAKRMWPFVKAMCENLIFVGKDYAVEGEALLPADVSDLMNRHRNQIKACFLGYTEIDAAKKMQEIKTYSEGPSDWLVSESDAYILDHITHMIKYSQFLKESCRTHKLTYFDVSKNFSSTINEAVRYLLAV